MGPRRIRSGWVEEQALLAECVEQEGQRFGPPFCLTHQDVGLRRVEMSVGFVGDDWLGDARRSGAYEERRDTSDRIGRCGAERKQGRCTGGGGLMQREVEPGADCNSRGEGGIPFGTR